MDEDKYVVDFDLERFFDMVSHSQLIKILSRGVKYGKVINLKNKYLHSNVINEELFEMSTQESPKRFFKSSTG